MYLEQRVEELEKEVAELKVIIHELRGYKSNKISVFKSNNELRHEIIKEAREFVEHNSNINHVHRNVWLNESKIGIAATDKVEFICNKDKRVVVALIKNIRTGRTRYKGVARCLPEDVFNLHIGKAIALGRALNIDTYKFEDAINPDNDVTDDSDVNYGGNK